MNLQHNQQIASHTDFPFMCSPTFEMVVSTESLDSKVSCNLRPTKSFSAHLHGKTECVCFRAGADASVCVC